MLARYFWASVTAGVLSVGCGGVTDAPDGDGTDGSDSSTGGNGSDGDGSGSGGSIATGGQPGEACQEYEDDKSYTSLEVRIINERSTSVFVGNRQESCGDAPWFSLSDEQGHDVRYAVDACSGTCETLRQSGPLGCLAICLVAEVTEIPPGQSHSVYWDTLIVVEQTLGADCISPESGVDAGTTCGKQKLLEPGTYTFRAAAGTELDCSQAFGELNCGSCDETDGTCGHVGGIVTGEELEAELTVKLDSSYGLVDPNAPPDDDTDIGIAKNIELRFTD